MNKELRTMEEKNRTNPNELMENGLTRAQNEKIEQNSQVTMGVIQLVLLGVSVWVMIKSMSLMSSL